MKIVVVDLDGTLCDTAHRNPLAVAGEWDQFHSFLGDDAPRPDVVWFLRVVQLANRPGPDEVLVLAVTGRNERYRDATMRWMIKHGVYGIDDILMRPDNNYEPDHELKPRLLREWMDEGDEVIAILEDRDKVVEAWRNLGFKCWQVAPGGY